MTSVKIPYDPEAERIVLASCLGGWCDDPGPGVLYDPVNERLRAAAASIVSRRYDSAGGRVRLCLVGFALDGADRELAEDLATSACVAHPADLALLRDLADRRTVMAELLDAVNAISEGADLGDALARVTVAA